MFGRERVTRRVVLGTHTGTHVDAPSHFIENGLIIDKVDLNVLIGQAKLIDMTHKGPYEKITPDDIEKSEVKIEKGDRIVLRTGWYKKWNTSEFYKSYPCLTEETAHYLVDKGIVLLCMDIPSPDDPQPKLGSVDSPIHKIFLSKNIIMCEYMTNLAELLEKFFLCALPLKLKDGDAFSARAIVVVD